MKRKKTKMNEKVEIKVDLVLLTFNNYLLF